MIRLPHFSRIVPILAAVAALTWPRTAAAPAQEVLALDGDVSPVHDPVVIKEGSTYLFFHAYYGAGLGRGSALQISTMVWEDGWPRVGTLR